MNPTISYQNVQVAVSFAYMNGMIEEDTLR